jgi:hypothetical protein
MMDKIKNSSNSEYHTPTSEPFSYLLVYSTQIYRQSYGLFYAVKISQH